MMMPMTRSIALFYFSGTGNTQVVAELLTEAFEKHGVDVSMRRIEQVLQEEARFDPDAYDLIGVGHPVHGFDAPRILYDFIAALPDVEKKRAFLFKTAGDFISINNAASKTAIKRLARKGYDVFYDRLICMPSNWAVKYDDDFSKQLYCAAVDKTAHMAGDILAGRERALEVASILRWGAWLLSRAEDWGARLFGQGLRVTDGCIDCGLCIENCPTDNIQREGNLITFGSDCLGCMRCIYACPQQAIEPRFAKFCVLKEGYDIRSIIEDESLEGDFVTEETKGFFGRFLEYVRDPAI